jgi:hypothetical protein
MNEKYWFDYRDDFDNETVYSDEVIQKNYSNYYTSGGEKLGYFLNRLLKLSRYVFTEPKVGIHFDSSLDEIDSNKDGTPDIFSKKSALNENDYFNINFFSKFSSNFYFTNVSNYGIDVLKQTYTYDYRPYISNLNITIFWIITATFLFSTAYYLYTKTDFT